MRRIRGPDGMFVVPVTARGRDGEPKKYLIAHTKNIHTIQSQGFQLYHYFKNDIIDL